MSLVRMLSVSLSLAAAAAVITACSAKVSSDPSSVIPHGPGSPQAPGGNAPAANAVAGPALNGRFKSECSEWQQGKYVILTYEFLANQRINRDFTVFDDSSCSHSVDFGQQNGTYRFVAKYGDDVYDTEYTLPGPDGFTKLQENIKVADTAVSAVSYRSHGNGIAPNIAMQLVDANDKPIAQPSKPGSNAAGGKNSLGGWCTTGPDTAKQAAIDYTASRGYTCRASDIQLADSASEDADLYKVSVQCDEGRGTVDVFLLHTQDGQCSVMSTALE